MYLEAIILQVSWSFTSWPRRSDLRDASRAGNQVTFEVIIVQIWIPYYSEFGDVLGGQDGVNSEIHFKAIIRQVWKCTWAQ